MNNPARRDIDKLIKAMFGKLVRKGFYCLNSKRGLQVVHRMSKRLGQRDGTLE